MKYYKKLYIGEGLADKREEVIRRLNQRELLLNTYIITLAQGEQNHLEFFDSILLHQEIIAEQKLIVVGIAAGYDEALEVVEKITREVYDETKDTDIRNYILNKEKEL